MTRMTREERKSETRVRLLAAAEAVFARRGYHAASVDEVCDEAGYSKGALYAHFASKEDLLMELIGTRMRTYLEDLAARFVRTGTLPERIREVVAFLAQTIEEKPRWCVLYIEFWTHAMRTPEVRGRLAEQYASWRTMTAALIETQADEAGVTLPLPADDLAAGVVAMFDGFILQQLVDPDRFHPDDFGNMLTVFLAGVSSLAGAAPLATLPETAGRPA